MPPERDSAGIVLLGSFNPSIFQPAWLAAQKLIPQGEAETAKIEIIHPDLTSFSTSWLGLQVSKERFAAFTQSEPHYAPLRDLVLGVFRVLEHTPFNQMGLNREMHFRVESESLWHDFGHRVAPKEIWKPALNNPGLNSLTLQETRAGDLPGALFVKVEPSRQIHPGVFFQTNDHYELKRHDPRALLNQLESAWHEILKRSLSIATTVLSSSGIKV